MKKVIRINVKKKSDFQFNQFFTEFLEVWFINLKEGCIQKFYINDKEVIDSNRNISDIDKDLLFKKDDAIILEKTLIMFEKLDINYNYSDDELKKKLIEIAYFMHVIMDICRKYNNTNIRFFKLIKMIIK